MSTKFNGFTQEEISKLSSKSKKVQIMNRGIRRVPEKKSTAPDDAVVAHSKPILKEAISASRKGSDLKLTPSDDLEETIASMQEVLQFRPLIKDQNGTNEASPVDESILHVSNLSTNVEAVADSPFKGVSLKDFESQRKMVEEQNKQKKELLHKAIEHHSQKTAAEIQKIKDIKAELDKLETDFAADVAILRKKIEEASLHFSNVQKNYERIESQFLKAKLELYQASEKKELLTEHLCTVIAYNEERKAKRLSELMEKVGMSPVGDIDMIGSRSIAD